MNSSSVIRKDVRESVFLDVVRFFRGIEVFKRASAPRGNVGLRILERANYLKVTQ